MPKKINHASIQFGKRVLYFRKRKKLSRRELAQICDVCHITIMNVEMGRAEPMLITAFKLADALDFKFDDLRSSVI